MMKEQYADVIIDISHEKLDRTFQYKIPAALIGQIKAGMKVTIPFGRGNKETHGYVIGLSDKAKFDPTKTKQIIDITKASATIESKLIALASWIRETYGSTMIQALKTVMPVKDKMPLKAVKVINLIMPREQVEGLLTEAKRKKHTAKERFLTALITNQELTVTELAAKLKIAPKVIKDYQEMGVIEVISHETFRAALPDTPVISAKEELSKQQLRVLQGIEAEWQDRGRTCLIHGVTGSGKTHVYIKLIEDTIAKGKQAIVLIPEIALTYQTVNRFYERFGKQVAIIHSRMSQGERSDSFEQARRGQIQIMIGPRSALFAPFAELGLLIIDEEHENAYRSENMPRYHAREVAIARGEIDNAKVILASATPSLEAYYRCQTDEYALFKMKERFGEGELPKVTVVDLREELKQGNNSIISRKLEESMAQALARREQIMLFLNRRGYAGFVSCRACGYVMKCEHCDVSLSLHNNGQMACHYCGYETVAVKKCPHCESPYIGGFKAGTQQIEEIVKKHFPTARVLRMDMDTTQGKHGHAKILSAFAKHEADILIGTQMIVKGHDFSKVTLMGVVAADLSLYADDYCCAERTFQLLVQAIGRAGRMKDNGEAIVQTYNPEHYCIEAAKSQDYEAFYEEEIGYRTLMDYPPVASMLAIKASGTNEAKLDMAMDYLKKYALKMSRTNRLSLIGPAKEGIARINDRYRRVLYLKHQSPAELKWIRDEIERYVEINNGFNDLYIQYVC